jgi:hypothetical protein
MIYICVFDDSFQNDRTLCSIFVLEIVLADGTIFSYTMHAIDASKHTWTSRLFKNFELHFFNFFYGLFQVLWSKDFFFKGFYKIVHILHSIITSILTKLTIFINGFSHLFHPQSFKMQLCTLELKIIQASMCNLVFAKKKLIICIDIL